MERAGCDGMHRQSQASLYSPDKSEDRTIKEASRPTSLEHQHSHRIQTPPQQSARWQVTARCSLDFHKVWYTRAHTLSHANTNKMKPAGRWGGRFTGGAERRTAGKTAWRQASRPTTQLILFLIFLYFKKKMRSIMNLPLGISLTTFQIQLLVCTILIFRIVFNMTLIQVI